VVKAGIRLTTENTTFDPPLRAPYEDWLRAFADMAALAIAEGDFRDDVDPETFARFLIPSYTGIQLVSDLFTAREDLLPRIRDLWGLVMPAVIAPDRMEQSRQLLARLIPQAP